MNSGERDKVLEGKEKEKNEKRERNFLKDEKGNERKRKS